MGSPLFFPGRTALRWPTSCVGSPSGTYSPLAYRTSRGRWCQTGPPRCTYRQSTTGGAPSALASALRSLPSLPAQTLSSHTSNAFTRAPHHRTRPHLRAVNPNNVLQPSLMHRAASSSGTHSGAPVAAACAAAGAVRGGPAGLAAPQAAHRAASAAFTRVHCGHVQPCCCCCCCQSCCCQSRCKERGGAGGHGPCRCTCVRAPVSANLERVLGDRRIVKGRMGARIPCRSRLMDQHFHVSTSSR